MTDAIAIVTNILDANWTKAPKPSIQDIANLDKGDGKRVRLQDKDVIRIFETAHNEAQPELLYDFVNEHINLTLDIRTVKSRERLSELRNEVRRILHGFRKGDGINFDRIIFKTRTDLSDRTKKLFRYTMQCEIVTFSLTAETESTFINPTTNAVSGANIYQTLSARLTELSLLTPTDGQSIVGNGDNWVVASTGDISSVVAGTGLTGGGVSGDVTLNVSGLTISQLAANTLQLSSESFADNDTTLMTSAAIKDYVDTIVGGAPGALDTLNELAAAINDDASFASTITTSIGTKLAKASNLSDLVNAGTARSNLGLGSMALLNSIDISSHTNLAVGTGLTLSGDTLSITDDSISEVKLDVTNTPTDNYILSYDQASGGFTWIAPASVGENNQNAFSTIAVSGQTSVAADSTTDTLTFVGGANVTITTTAGSDTITFTTTDTNTEYSVGDGGLTQNNFTNALKTKLDGIEASADVTDSANVKSALGGAIGGDALQIGDGSTTTTFPGSIVVTGTTTTNHVETVSTSNGVIFEGSNADNNEVSLKAGTVSADRTITLPDATGTIALTSQLTTDTNTQNVFTSSFVDSTNDILLRLTKSGASSGTQDIKFVAGSNVSLTHTDANNITISSTDTNTVYTHPNHSGEVTSSADGATVIASNVVDEDNLKVTNSPTDNYILSYDQASGGFTWIDAASAGGANQNAFSNVAVSGQTTVAADSSTDTLTLAAGSNVTITTTAGTDTVTIASTDTNTEYSVGDGGLTQNNFTDALKSKLDAIEAAADVTDLANITTALAALTGDDTLVMGDSGDDTTVRVRGNLVVTGTTTTENVETLSTSNGVVFEGSAANNNELTLKAGTVSADRTVTIPDATFTIPTQDTTYSIGDGGLTQNNFTNTLKSKLDGIAASANNFSLPTAASDTLGGIKVGANLSINGSGVLQIDENAVDSSELKDGAIDESHLNATNSPTDNYLLSYDQASGGFTWIAAGAGGENNQNAFSNVAVSGQTTAAADSTTDTLTLVAAGGMTITTSGDSITLNSANTNTTYSAGIGIALSGTTFALTDPANLNALDESSDATDDKILLWDESASEWKHMTLDNLQDSIDTTATGGAGEAFKTISVSGQSNVVADAAADTLTLVAGSNVTITTNASSDTITFASTDTNTDTNTQNVFTSSFVDSSNDTILRLTKSGASSGTQDIKFVAGSNVTLTPSGTNLTIAATDTNTQLSQEQVEDYVNGVIVAGSNITKTYDDAAGTLTIAATDTNTEYSVGDGGLTQNNFTNTLKSKLDAIEASATADQTASEITALLNDVASYSLGTNGSGTIAVNHDMTVAGDLTVTGTTITNNVETVSTSNGVQFEGSAANDNEILLKAGTVSADRTIVLPDASGTISLSDTNTNQLTTFTLTGDSGTNQTIAHGNTLDVAGGTGIATAVGNTDTVTVNLSHLGIESLSDPNADRILIWDNTTNAAQWATPAANLAISGNLAGGLVINATDTNTQLTTEAVQDIVGGMFSSNTETRVAATYDDTNGKINVVVDDMTANDNTFRTITAGGNTLGTAETLAFTAGSNVTITESGGAVTIASTDTNTDTNTQNVFTSSFVDSSNDTILRLTKSGASSGTQDIKFVAGSNVSLTPSGTNLTIAATDTNTEYSAGTGLALSGTTFSMADPADGTSIDEGTIAADDRMPIWDESASSWKYVTIDNLQDEIDTTASGGAGEAFKTIAVSGQSNVVADSATDTLTLAAGTNIALTTNASSDTVTIASAAGNVTLANSIQLTGGTSTNFRVKTGAVASSGASLSFSGSDNNAIATMTFSTAGYKFNKVNNGGSNLIFEGDTTNAYETTLDITDPTADRTIVLPDASGTISLTDTNTFRTITAGGNTLGSSETLAFTAGSNVTITESGGAVTIASTDTNTDTNTQNIFTSSFVDSSNDTILRLTKSGASSGTQDIKFVAGSNITLTPSGTNLTIAATDTNTDTTYSAGNGIALSGTTFSVAAGTGLSQSSSGLALSHLGLQSLSDPNADRVLGWDDSAGTLAWFTLNSNITSSGTNINATDTNTNTTYSAGTGITLSSTTFSHTAHTGEVTGATSLTIADNVVDEANLKVSNSPSDNQVLSYNAATGGFTWINDANTDTNTEYTAGTLLDLSGTTFNVDLSEATETTVAVADDYFLFLDGGATGATKKEAIADLVAAMAGNNLSASNGVLSATDTNTNTTYSAGNGIALSSTTFSVAAGTGLSQASNGLALSHLGIESLSDPGADKILIWDDSAGAIVFATPNSNLAISGTNINATDTNTTYSEMGSGNSYAAGLVIAGSATHSSTFLRKDGTWATPTNTNTNQLTTFTLTADSGTNQTIAHGNTFDIAGGTGLATVVGATDTVTINLDIDGMTDIGAALADADLMIVDDGAGGTNRKATMSRLKTYMQNGLTFTTNTNTEYTAGTLLDLSGTTFNVDLSEATEAAVAVASDYVLFLDGGATGATKKESIVDLIAATAGTNLTAASGVLSATNTTYSAGTNISLSGTTFNVDDAFLVNNGNDTTTGTITAGGFTTAGSITLGGHAVADIDVGTEFVDTDDHLMSSGAIREKIESYSYSTTDTTYSAGTNISLSGTTFNVDDAFIKNNANDTTTGTITAGGFTTSGSITLGGHAFNDIDIGSEFVDTDDHLMSSGAIKEKIEDYGYTTNTGDATLAGTQSFTGAKTFTSTLQGYKTVIKAVSSNTVLADADSGKTIYWTGGTLQLPPTAEVGQQFVIINNTNGAATPNLGTSNAVATNWTAHAAMADETARTYICPEANKWIYIG